MKDQEIVLHQAMHDVENDKTAMILDHLRPPEPKLATADHRRFLKQFACLSELWQYKKRITLQSVKDYLKDPGIQEVHQNRHKLLQEFLRRVRSMDFDFHSIIKKQKMQKNMKEVKRCTVEILFLNI